MLLFEDDTRVKIKDYNVMNDGINLFDWLVKNDMRTYENIRKVITS